MREDSEVEELPAEFAIPLGQILFTGGPVGYLLGQLIPPAPDRPAGLGLRGGPLAKELRKSAVLTTELDQILAGYEEQMTWRNWLIHGSHSYSNGTLWTWFIPVRGRGMSAQSFQFSLVHVQQLAENWRNLEVAAHDELHRSR